MRTPTINLRHNLSSIARWLFAGLIFMGVNTALLYLFVQHLGITIPLSTLLSAEICTIFRFLLNDAWVFRIYRPTWRKLWQYHVANATAFFIWWISANVLNRLGINYLLASILAVGFSTTVSFASNFLWIWRAKHSKPVV